MTKLLWRVDRSFFVNLFNSENPNYYLVYLGSGIRIRHDYCGLLYMFLQTLSYSLELFLSFMFSLFSGGRVNPIPRVRPSGFSFNLFEKVPDNEVLSYDNVIVHANSKEHPKKRNYLESIAKHERLDYKTFKRWLV